ncbi:unnamed protein product [Trichobilharzia szidati]|nr:unnamed protein product [Trichobilharzia szidati]CAH8874337.1 unnamed protein product [Trichobilharzia szidati]
MTGVTQSQVDRLISELGPHVDTEEHRVGLGLKVYGWFLKAKPEYIPKFSRLQGLDESNFAQSEGIKYYARTLIDALVPILQAAANKNELDKLCLNEAVLHRTRQVSEETFKNSLPIFLDIFDYYLEDPENKETMRKILKYVFPAIGTQI